jgi:cytochrome P450
MSSVDSRRTIPGPRQWPVLGNPGALAGLIPFMERQRHAHGDMFRMRVLSFRAVAFSHPEHMQHVLVTQRDRYVKGNTYDSTRKVLGNGLVTLDGSAWKKRRALAQPAFHRKALEKLAEIMAAKGELYFDDLATRVSKRGATLDAHREMVKLTLDVVVAALFGEGTLASSDISYEALNDALRVLSTGVNGFNLPDWMPTPHNLKLKKTVRALDRNVYQIIEAGRRMPSNGSLLSMLLEARDEQGAPLSDEEIRDEVITLFIAGHETSALTLAWLLTFLDGRPEVLAQLCEEVDRVLSGRTPSFDDVPKLVFVRQVIDETLRLRPAAPMIARNLVADDVLGGHALRAGDVVIPYLWGLHRQPEYWPEPERFDPARFSAGLSKTRHPFSYLPFSGGPRGCIGNMFAITELVMLVAQLLSRFVVEVQPCADVKPVAIGTTRPSRPIWVTFKPR